jgi:hypothetical protein
LGFAFKVPGHGLFARGRPHHRQGAPACHQVAPVPFHVVQPDHGQVIAPGPDEAGNQTLFDEVEHALVGFIKKTRVDLAEVMFPGKSAPAAAPLVKQGHVRVQTRHQLDQVEAQLLPVLYQGLEIVRPGQALAQAHPPGVTKPEEGCAVGMAEMPPVAGHTQAPVAVQRVVTQVRLDLHLPRLVVQADVAGVAAPGSETMTADLGRRIARAPDPTTRPEGGHHEALVRRRGEGHIQLDIPPRLQVVSR